MGASPACPPGQLGCQAGQAGNTRQGTFKQRLARSVARLPARVFRGKRALDLAAFFAAEDVRAPARVFLAAIDVARAGRDVGVTEEVANKEDVSGFIGELGSSGVPEFVRMIQPKLVDHLPRAARRKLRKFRAFSLHGDKDPRRENRSEEHTSELQSR